MHTPSVPKYCAEEYNTADAYSKQRGTTLLVQTPSRGVQHYSISKPTKILRSSTTLRADPSGQASALCPPKYIGREMQAPYLSLAIELELPENYYCLLIALPVTIIG